jgi:hypothetical protein
MGYYPRRIVMMRVILTGNTIMAKNSILGVFAKSPIKPLEKHIQIVVKCSKQLIPFFERTFDFDDIVANFIGSLCGIILIQILFADSLKE